MSRLFLLAIVSLMPMIFAASCSSRRAPEGLPSPESPTDTLVAVRGGRIVIEREVGTSRPGEIGPDDSALMARAVSVRAEPASITMWVGDTIPVRHIRLIVLDGSGTPVGFLGAMRDAHLLPGAASLVPRSPPGSRGAAEGAVTAGGDVDGMSIKANSAGQGVMELRVPRVLWMGRAGAAPMAEVRITVLAERSP